jgi:SEC-C motif-containing protein
MTMPDAAAPLCPCESGRTLTGCCLPFLRREAQPPTPEALMRSRFTAFARKDADHLWRTWHPRTRPGVVPIDPNIRWDGLTVVTTTGGSEADDTGTVTFKARFTSTGGPGVFREHSRFERRAGRWLYVDGDQNS